MLTADQQYCLNRLRNWLARMKAVCADVHRAHELYVALKADLREQHRELGRARRDHPPSEAERRYYTHPIAKAPSA